MKCAIAVGDESEAKEFDEQSGEDEGEALLEACEQQKSRQREKPTRDH